MKRHLFMPVFVSLMLLLISGCGKDSVSGGKSGNIKAVYLIPYGGGIIPAEELKGYPEIAVTGSFEELKSYAAEKCAVWIDRGAAGLVDLKWLYEGPQKFYPIVLIGCPNALYSFREILSMDIEGPDIDWRGENLEGGYSIWMLKNKTAGSKSAYMKGYSKKPTPKALLKITDIIP